MRPANWGYFVPGAFGSYSSASFMLLTYDYIAFEQESLTPAMAFSSETLVPAMSFADESLEPMS
jgi:hypothetical protein